MVLVLKHLPLQCSQQGSLEMRVQESSRSFLIHRKCELFGRGLSVSFMYIHFVPFALTFVFTEHNEWMEGERTGNGKRT